MQKVDKVEIEAFVTILRDQLSHVDFDEVMSSLLEMPEEEFDELLKMADILEETANQ